MKENLPLLRKYLLAGLQQINKQNYLEDLPDLSNQEEIEAFSKSLEMIGRWIAKEPGAAEEILEVLTGKDPE